MPDTKLPGFTLSLALPGLTDERVLAAFMQRLERFLDNVKPSVLWNGPFVHYDTGRRAQVELPDISEADAVQLLHYSLPKAEYVEVAQSVHGDQYDYSLSPDVVYLDREGIATTAA